MWIPVGFCLSSNCICFDNFPKLVTLALITIDVLIEARFSNMTEVELYNLMTPPLPRVQTITTAYSDPWDKNRIVVKYLAYSTLF